MNNSLNSIDERCAMLADNARVTATRGHWTRHLHRGDVSDTCAYLLNDYANRIIALREAQAKEVTP